MINDRKNHVSTGDRMLSMSVDHSATGMEIAKPCETEDGDQKVRGLWL